MMYYKILSLYCLVSFAALCSGDNYLREGEACLVQYLKGKGKLDRNFHSALRASSQCRLITPITIQILKNSANEQIKTKLPNEADCLTEEFDNKETIDLAVKTNVISTTNMLSESDRESILIETRNKLRDDLEKIAVQCLTDDKIFVQIFDEYFGIKNESLGVLQYEYCLAKYAADNKLLELDNVEINPHRIDTDNINCNYIIEYDRSKQEKDLTDKMSARSKGERSLQCILNSYKNDKIFESMVALKVLNQLEIPSETKEKSINRISGKMGAFAVKTFTCFLDIDD